MMDEIKRPRDANKCRVCLNLIIRSFFDLCEENKIVAVFIVLSGMHEAVIQGRVRIIFRKN